MNSKKTVLILAGGLGSRYNGLKQVEGILDNHSPILEYSIYDALQAGFNKIVLILNRSVPYQYILRIKDISIRRNFELQCIYQDVHLYVPESFNDEKRKKPWGTGHAVLCAREVINEPFVMINADDFYGKEAFQLASQEIDKGEISEKQFEIIAYPVETTLSENGTVARGICKLNNEDFLIKIEEQTSIRKENNLIVYSEKRKNITISPNTLVSMNFTIFHPTVFTYLDSYFKEFLNSEPSDNEEFYIPFVIQKMIDCHKVKVRTKKSPSIWKGITYPQDKKILQEYLENEIERETYPKNLWN